MKEFSIRNKTTRPSMTLTPAMFERMLAARPESVSLVLAKRVRDYKQITGKTLVLDHNQQQALLARAGADARGMWTSKYTQLPYPVSQVNPIFADGFMLRSLEGSMLEDLELVESFYELLDTQLIAKAAGNPAAPDND